MKTFKNILLTIGAISLILFVILLILGLKVVSTIFLYILGGIAVISLIGYGLFSLGKWSGKSESKD